MDWLLKNSKNRFNLSLNAMFNNIPSEISPTIFCYIVEGLNFINTNKVLNILLNKYFPNILGLFFFKK
jgi:hypothetical protein